MTTRRGLLLALPIGLLGTGCNPQPPADPIVRITSEAVRQVFRYRDRHRVSGPWRLRVGVQERPGLPGKHTVDLDPTRPDQRSLSTTSGRFGSSSPSRRWSGSAGAPSGIE